ALAQPLDGLDRARDRLETEGANEGLGEVRRIDPGPESVQEDSGAVAPQRLQRLRVVAEMRVRAVVRRLRGEGGLDLRGIALEAVLEQDVAQGLERVHEAKQRPEAVDGDGVE